MPYGMTNQHSRRLAVLSMSAALSVIMVPPHALAQLAQVPETIEGEMKQKALGVLQHELSLLEHLRRTANTLGYKPAGFDAYYKENGDIIRANIERFKARQKISGKRYLDYSLKKVAHVTELAPSQLFADIVRHEKHYESEASKPQTVTICLPNSDCKTTELTKGYDLGPIRVLDSKVDANGRPQFAWKDLTLAEAHTLASDAMSIRHPTLRLGHVLGDLHYTLKEKQDELSDLRQKASDLKVEVQRIERRLVENRDNLERAEKELQTAVEQENERLEPFLKTSRETAKKLDQLHAAYKLRLDEGKVVNGHPEHVQRLQRDWSRKNFALDSLKDQLTRTENAGVRQSLEDLKGQLSNIRNQLREMGAPVDPNDRPPRNPEEQRALEDAETKFEAAIVKLNKERAHGYSAMSPKRNRVYAVQRTVSENSALLARLNEQLIAAKKAAWLYDAGGLPDIQIIETRDARYELKRGVINKAEELDQMIAAKTQMHAKINAEMAAVHAHQKELRAKLDEAANALSEAAEGSYSKQAVAQWMVQTLMVLKDGKGASPAALAAAGNQIAVNLIFQPEFYDTVRDKDGSITTTRSDAKKRAVGVAQSGVAQVGNQIATPRELKMMEAVLENEWVAKNLDEVAPVFGQRQAMLKDIKSALNTNGKSLKARMLGAAGGVALGVVVDFLTEELKAEIAEMATSLEWQFFIDAQIEFAKSVEEATLLKHVSRNDLADLEALRRQREALGGAVDAQDLPDGLTWRPEYLVKKNERFDSEAGYWFSVALKEPAPGLTISRPLNFDFYVEGHKLELASTTSQYNKIYTLDATLAKTIEDKILKDDLTITISIK